MRPSLMSTIAVPDVGTNTPATVITAANVPMRVAVRNVGGAVVFFAHTVNELADVGLVSGVYQLPPGQSEVFVLTARQALYCVGQGAGGRMCYAASEAIPTSFMES